MRLRLASLIACLCALATLAPAALAQDHERLQRALRSAARPAGASAGFLVVDAGERRVLFALRDRRARVLASNAKLFTTAAALDRIGASGTIPTVVLGDGVLGLDGTFAGDLYLRGGGDPAFGSAAYVRRAFGSPATADALADQLHAAGVRTINGRVIGDESAFDALRGGPDSGYGPSQWHAPLSALTFDGGRNRRGAAPPLHAARAFDDALEERGIAVRRSPTVGAAPATALRLAGVESMPIARMIRIVNKPSSNFFAEMLLKRLAVAPGEQGTTRRGAAIARDFAAGLGANATITDGSGLHRGNRASPRAVVRLLQAMRGRSDGEAFRNSLAIAGRDGTLARRMRGPARGRCRAKTGTLSGVSALSGYCTARSGRTIVFSFLANGVNTSSMKRIEDRMATAIVRYG